MILSIAGLVDPRIIKTGTKPLSFFLEPSKALAIKGVNGSGKTTLLKIIVGILEPEKIDSIKICDSYAYLPHTNALYGHLKIGDYLTDSCSLGENFSDKMIDDLSSGQKRNLALYLFKQTDRRFWIIDEPTTYLDEESKENFYKDVKKHCDRGGSVLISTHDYVPDFFQTMTL